jgi:hypothetical protein
MKLTPENCLFIFLGLYVGFWVFAILKESRRLSKLPGKWEHLNKKDDNKK